MPLMMKRVRMWLAKGEEVRILTARVSPVGPDHQEARAAIELWCVQHVGVLLPVTHEKDFDMIDLWDDRCVQVEKNTGRRMDGRKI